MFERRSRGCGVRDSAQCSRSPLYTDFCRCLSGVWLLKAARVQELVLQGFHFDVAAAWRPSLLSSWDSQFPPLIPSHLQVLTQISQL